MMIAMFIVASGLYLARGLRTAVIAKYERCVVAALCAWAAALVIPEAVPYKVIDLMGRFAGTAAVVLMAADLLTQAMVRARSKVMALDHFTKVLPEPLEEICTAMEIMASRNIGALVVIKRHDPLEGHISGGMPYDSEIRSEILPTLFAHTSPVHDGAVIVVDGRIVRVKTVLPIKTTSPISLGVGTRHRAAVGLTEKTDVIVLVSSEERGELSVANRGKLVKPASPEEFRALVLAGLKGKDISAVHAAYAGSR